MATKKKCMSCGSSMKKMKTGGITQNIVGMPGYNATTRPMQMKKGGSVKALAIKKTGGVKKSLPKAQPGVSVGTPFQGYLKNNPGAVASDTIMKTIYPNSSWDAPKNPVAKNPKNQGVLEKMFEKTYGQGWKSESGQPAKGETFEQYKRRMGPSKQKMGGATKAKKK